MNDENTKATETPDSAASALSAGLGAWLPIATAPKDGTEILVYTISECCYVVTYDDVWSAPWRIRNDEGLNAAVPTHWMPLPDAPNDQAQGAGGGLIAGGSPGAAGCAAQREGTQ